MPTYKYSRFGSTTPKADLRRDLNQALLSIETELDQKSHGELSVVVSANQNNYAPTGFGLAKYLYLTASTANVTITSWLYSAALVAGSVREKIIMNHPSSTFSILLTHLDGAAAITANQLYIPGGGTIYLSPGDSVRIYASTALGKWMAV